MKSLLFVLLIPILAGAASPVQQPAPPATQAAKKQVGPYAPSLAPKKEEDCGCEVNLPADAFATVNGVKIGKTEIEAEIKEQVEQVQGQVPQARQKELQFEIDSKILDREAAKRGITVSKLVDLEVTSKLTKPTDADAQEFYDKNKDRLQGDFKDLKEDLLLYLYSEKQRDGAEKLAESLRPNYQVKVLVQYVTAPETAADREKVLATVEGKNITSGDVEVSLRAFIYNVQQTIYQIRKNALDVRINDALLTQEAEKQKTTTKQLLDTQVLGKIKTVTDADAQAFYDKFKDKMPGPFDEIKPKIIAYLHDQELREAETTYADTLHKGATIQVYLKAPTPPVFKIATDNRPSRGKADAPITIVEFTDFQCPSCARTQPILEQLLTEYGDKVRLVIRDFPLDRHQNAFIAAQAAEAAKEQGKFWEYSDVLFKNQTALETDKLKEYATQLGLDRGKFDGDLDSGKYADTVRRDMKDGDKLGVDSTPTIFINGHKMEGDKTHDGIKAAIDQALGETAKKE
jgi:protein-disulfide isomerase